MRASSARQPCPAAGTIVADRRALAAAPQPLEPGAARARARRSRRRPAAAAACPRSRAARAPPGPAAAPAAARAGAGCSCPPPRPRAGRRATPHRRAHRARPPARARPTIDSPSGSSAGTSFAECTAMSTSSRSSASSISFVKRDLSSGPAPRSPEVVIGTSSTSASSSSATSRACASASALPRVPSRSVKRRRGGGAARLELGDLRGRALVARRGGRRARAARARSGRRPPRRPSPSAAAWARAADG